MREVSLKIRDALSRYIVPWKIARFPKNYVTNLPYFNTTTLVLHLKSIEEGYKSEWWATRKQWRDSGFELPRKTEATSVCVYRGMSFTELYNSDQLVSFPGKRSDIPTFLIENLLEKTGVTVQKGSKPLFDREKKVIILPPRNEFLTDDHYTNSCIHELVHWAESFLPKQISGSENKLVASSELIAEIGTGYFNGLNAIPHDGDLTNYNYFLKDWLKYIQEEDRYIFDICFRATRCVKTLQAALLG